MADNSKIEWTNATWNTIGGCTRVDEGCRNCYAEVMAARFNGPGQWGEGLAQIVTAGGKKDHRWTGKVAFNDKALTAPLRWKKPRLIFVNSTADTFHESVPDEWIDRIFAVMALCPQHTFQVLTKRPDRAREYLTGLARFRIAERMHELQKARGITIYGFWKTDGDFDDPEEEWRPNWPLPNVWLGTSVSDQASADARIPDLLATLAAVRFVSAEPLLGPVDLLRWSGMEGDYDIGLDWVIVGGESGPKARPMEDNWARDILAQCKAAGVPAFMKQMGGKRKPFRPIPDGMLVREFPNAS